MTNFESINATQALQMLENDNNVTLLDIRTIEEYEEGHLRGATFIPVQVLEQKLDMLKQDKDKKIIVYCRSGNRSIRGSRILEKHGFTPLNVKGGINALKKANADIIK